MQIGLGAAGLAICRLLMAYGVNEMYGTDLQQSALDQLEGYGGIPLHSLEELMNKCDIVIATTGVPRLIKPEMIHSGLIIL